MHIHWKLSWKLLIYIAWRDVWTISTKIFRALSLNMRVVRFKRLQRWFCCLEQMPFQFWVKRWRIWSWLSEVLKWCSRWLQSNDNIDAKKKYLKERGSKTTSCKSPWGLMGVILIQQHKVNPWNDTVMYQPSNRRSKRRRMIHLLVLIQASNSTWTIRGRG